MANVATVAAKWLAGVGGAWAGAEAVMSSGVSYGGEADLRGLSKFRGTFTGVGSGEVVAKVVESLRKYRAARPVMCSWEGAGWSPRAISRLPVFRKLRLCGRRRVRTFAGHVGRSRFPEGGTAGCGVASDLQLGHRL